MITTLRTLAGTGQCPDVATCPGVHELDTDPEHRYVIAKTITDPEELVVFDGQLTYGELPGWMPADFLPPGNDALTRTRRIEHPGRRPGRDYVITTAVTDPAVLREFAHLMGAGEHLGTVPVAALMEV